jgi:hypothetical protein
MRFAFQFVPIRFALLSSAIYLAPVAGLAMLAAFINVVVFKNWGFSASRSVWLVLNAGVFLAASVLAWRILYARHLG